MPLHVGGCAVFAYHDVQDAPRLHAQFKESHLDAAVVDHAFCLSPLQLAVAWQRAEQDKLFDTERQHHRNAREPVARGLFLGLSASNQLHRALQVLTAGTATTAVVILIRESDLDDAKRAQIEAVAQSCHAVPHEIDPFVPGHVVRASSSSKSAGEGSEVPTRLPRLVEPRKLAEYYQISDAEVRAARRSLCGADERLLRQQCAQSGLTVPESGPVWEELVNLKALEVCVVQKLALYDC